MISRIARLCAIAALSPALAVAAPLTANELPQSLLAACESRAAALSRAEAPIVAAARDLIAMGVFREADFDGVGIGFCGLKAAGGPAATANCANDSILADEGFASDDQRLPLVAVLAHEMRHHQQHQERKAAGGEGYCESAAYAAEKPELEAEADAFGDAVAALFFVGRDVEIVNDCKVDIALYVEADEALAPAGPARFTAVAALSRESLALKALSGEVRFYAQSQPRDGVRYVWRGPNRTDLRFIGGKPYALKRATLQASSPTEGPFRLRLSCPGATVAPKR
jgi:hypothetical protein